MRGGVWPDQRRHGGRCRLDAIDAQRLLETRTGTRQLLNEALVRLKSTTEPHNGWLDELVARRIPADDRGYWFLAALATQD